MVENEESAERETPEVAEAAEPKKTRSRTPRRVSASSHQSAGTETGITEVPVEEKTETKKSKSKKATEAKEETEAAEKTETTEEGAEPKKDLTGRGRGRAARAREEAKAAAIAAGETIGEDIESVAEAKKDGKAKEVETENSEDSAATEETAVEGEEKTTTTGRRTRDRRRVTTAETTEEKATDPNGQSELSSNGRSRENGHSRDRRRRSSSDDLEFEISDDDILLPIAGILDVLDNYGFVRTTGYLSGNADVYVSLGQVRRYGLRKGDAIVGAIRQPREGENQRQKYNAIVKIDTVNGKPLAEALERPEFARLTPIYPNERLRLETGAANLTGRAIDIAAPIGKGQRALLIAEPRTDRGGVLKSIAESISENNPEVHLMYLAVNERPEEITEIQRVIRGEVIASPFDHPAEDHAAVSELAIERAKRMVELGNDVVMLVDSLTGLARAYNQIAPTSGRFLVEGVDTATVFPSKRFFGAARNVENGGSLTIIAAVLSGYGSIAEEAILEELRVAANSEIKLSKKLADSYSPVQVDVHSSGTKHAQQLSNEDEISASFKLRTQLEGADVVESGKNLVQKLEATSTNTELLFSAQRAASK